MSLREPSLIPMSRTPHANLRRWTASSWTPSSRSIYATFFSSSYQNFTSRSRPLYVESLVTLNGRIHEVRSGMKEPQSWRCGDFLHMVCFGAITKRPCENDGVSW